MKLKIGLKPCLSVQGNYLLLMVLKLPIGIILCHKKDSYQDILSTFLQSMQPTTLN